MIKIKNAGNGGPGYAKMTVNRTIGGNMIEIETTRGSEYTNIQIDKDTALHLAKEINRIFKPEPKRVKLFEGKL